MSSSRVALQRVRVSPCNVGRSTWCGVPASIAEMRQYQLEPVSKLQKVAYATNADHGAGCNIHPPPKQYCGARLGASALALEYSLPIAWKVRSSYRPADPVATGTLSRSFLSVAPVKYPSGLSCMAAHPTRVGSRQASRLAPATSSLSTTFLPPDSSCATLPTTFRKAALRPSIARLSMPILRVHALGQQRGARRCRCLRCCRAMQ